MSISISQVRKNVVVTYRKQFKGRKINLKYYPGIKADRIVRQKTKDREANKKLSRIKIIIEDLQDEVDFTNITSKEFSQLINNKLSGKSGETTSFYQYCQMYFQQELSNKGMDQAKHIKKIINILQKFDTKLTFADIDRKFYNRFLDFLNDSGFSKNYSGSIIKDIRRILNYATEMGVNSNMEYLSFKKISEEVYNVYLSESEIERIYGLDITPEVVREWHISQQERTGANKKNLNGESIRRQVNALKNAKRLFVVGCWTGLRVENYLNIDPEIQVDLETGFLHAIANKNGPKLKIPLHRIVKEIYQNEGLPGQMSQQKLNDHLKIIGELAGIDEKIMFTRTIGGKRKEFTKLKYEMITSHTARRSFASNLIIRGIPKQYIMAVTGHKKETSFNKYTQAVQGDMLTEKLKGYDVWD